MPDEDRPFDPLGMIRREHRGHTASDRVTDDRHPRDLQRIEHVDGLLRPQCRPQSHGVRAIRETVTVVVEAYDAMSPGESNRKALLPIGDAATRPVHEEDHRTGP